VRFLERHIKTLPAAILICRRKKSRVSRASGLYTRSSLFLFFPGVASFYPRRLHEIIAHSRYSCEIVSDIERHPSLPPLDYPRDIIEKRSPRFPRRYSPFIRELLGAASRSIQVDHETNPRAKSEQERERGRESPKIINSMNHVEMKRR